MREFDTLDGILEPLLILLDANRASTRAHGRDAGAATSHSVVENEFPLLRVSADEMFKQREWLRKGVRLATRLCRIASGYCRGH